MKLKNALLMGALFLSVGLFAQATDKELDKHYKAVEKSRAKKKGIASLDTFFYAGEPQSLHKTLEKGLFGMVLSYSLHALETDQELVLVNFNNIGDSKTAEYVHDVIFPAQGVKLRLENSQNPLDLLGKYAVLEPTQINTQNLNKMLLVLGQPTINLSNPQATQPTNKAQLVERNRNGMIQIIGNRILQGGVEIGTLSKENQAGDGKIITHIQIKHANGQLAAVAKNQGVTSHEWTLTTASDNKVHTLNSSIGKDEEDIVKTLISLLYL
jgi:hypothetical protein